MVVLLCVTGARAAQVLQVSATQKVIAISNEAGKPWNLNDEVCVFHAASKVICGVVTKALAKGAIVKWEVVASDKIEKGDNVLKAGVTPAPVQAQTPAENPPAVSPTAIPRKLSSKEAPPVILSEETVTSSPANNYGWDVMLGAGASKNYYFGQFNFQMGLGNHFSMGPLFTLADSSLGDVAMTALTLFVTLNFYSREPFHGIWVQAGAGPQLYAVKSGSVIESTYTFGGILTGGYRTRFEIPALNVGIGAGFMYVASPKTQIIPTLISSFQPTILFDLGFNF